MDNQASSGHADTPAGLPGVGTMADGVMSGQEPSRPKRGASPASASHQPGLPR